MALSPPPPLVIIMPLKERTGRQQSVSDPVFFWNPCMQEEKSPCLPCIFAPPSLLPKLALLMRLPRRSVQRTRHPRLNHDFLRSFWNLQPDRRTVPTKIITSVCFLFPDCVPCLCFSPHTLKAFLLPGFVRLSPLFLSSWAATCNALWQAGGLSQVSQSGSEGSLPACCFCPKLADMLGHACQPVVALRCQLGAFCLHLSQRSKRACHLLHHLPARSFSWHENLQTVRHLVSVALVN